MISLCHHQIPIPSAFRILLLLPVIFCIGCDRNAKTYRADQPLAAGDTISFSLISENGWTLEVYPGGSGELKYGTAPRDKIQVPEKTFGFRELMTTIDQALTLENDTNENGFRLSFLLASQNGSQITYLTDRKLAREIYQKAYLSGLKSDSPRYNRRRIRKLFRNDPPTSRKNHSQGLLQNKE